MSDTSITDYTSWKREQKRIESGAKNASHPHLAGIEIDRVDMPNWELVFKKPFFLTSENMSALNLHVDAITIEKCILDIKEQIAHHWHYIALVEDDLLCQSQMELKNLLRSLVYSCDKKKTR